MRSNLMATSAGINRKCGALMSLLLYGILGLTYSSSNILMLLAKQGPASGPQHHASRQESSHSRTSTTCSYPSLSLSLWAQNPANILLPMTITASQVSSYSHLSRMLFSMCLCQASALSRILPWHFSCLGQRTVSIPALATRNTSYVP